MKGEFLLTTILSFFFGFCSYFILYFFEIENAFWFSVLAGLLVHILLYPFFIIHKAILNNKYSKFEQQISSPILYKANGNFNLGNGKIKNGNIYLCETSIICVGLDEKPYSVDEILLQDIDHFQFNNINLNIITKDDRIFLITLPDAKNVADILKDTVYFN